MVFLAHGDAAAGDDHIVVHGGIGQRGNRGLAVVGNNAQIRHLAAHAQQQCTQEEAVAVVDAARWHVLRRHGAGHDQFIAGGEQGHTRLACHLQAGKAHAGSQTQVGRREAGAGLDHGRALRDVLARAANPLAGTGWALMRTRPSSSNSQSSCMTMASAPAGTGAP
jgi:hypothetical protein